MMNTTVLRDILAKVHLPSIKGLAFDLDGTLAPAGHKIKGSMARLLLWFLEETPLHLAFVTGSSLEESLWPRVAQPLWEEMQQRDSFPLEKTHFYGDGGGASLRLARDERGEPKQILDQGCLDYVNRFAFSEEVLDFLPFFQKELDRFLAPHRDHLSLPLPVATSEGWILEPLEVHSPSGREKARKAAWLLEEKSRERGLPLKASVNYWGCRMEVEGKIEEDFLLSLICPFGLAYPGFGVRRLQGIITELLIKPVKALGGRDLRQEILAFLPEVLKKKGLSDTNSFVAGRTAIDILKGQCSKKTALEDFRDRIGGGPLWYFGDEFLKGNDGAALEVQSLIGFSVRDALEREEEKLFWLGGGAQGTMAFLEEMKRTF